MTIPRFLLLYSIRFSGFLFASVGTADIPFDPAATVTSSSENVEFSRIPHGQIAADSQGRIHLVYSIMDATASSPIYHVMYRRMENGVFSPPIRVDRGEIGGGRHPSLALDAKDTLHVVWHDYRNCTAAGHGVDNIEIYYSRKAIDGDFLASDIRLTQTQADHKADNGYLPRIYAAPDGRLHVAWYDFNRDGIHAEIFLKSSDPLGVFDFQPGIDSERIAGLEEGGEFASFWTPNLAPDGEGNLYVQWGFSQGYTGSYQIQARTVSANRSLGAIETLAGEGGTFYDPPRLAYDGQGNLGLAYEIPSDGMSRVVIQYRPKGGTWESPIVVNSGETDAVQPDMAFDSQGQVYVVWQENTGNHGTIVLALVDPASRTVKFRQRISGEEEDARTPTLALDSRDRVHFIWCDFREDGSGFIRYMRETGTGIMNWKRY